MCKHFLVFVPQFFYHWLRLIMVCNVGLLAVFKDVQYWSGHHLTSLIQLSGMVIVELVMTGFLVRIRKGVCLINKLGAT